MNAGVAVVLTGPTGSGKSDWALRLAGRLPVEIISVDSAQVFRGLDIGTAKPGSAARALVRHHLLDLRDPAERYSAGDFVRDACSALAGIRQRGRLPVLVGGTMLYLRALLRGMAVLPTASPAIRAELEAAAAQRGWPALHDELARVDPDAAARIHRNDPQRIQRALEVYRLTGRPISAWQTDTAPPLPGMAWLRFALIPEDRRAHLRQLERRFDAMMENGLLGEVDALFRRKDLSAELPALRSVGYRQLWAYLAGHVSLDVARRQAVMATGQLAKRQLTWLRAEGQYERLNPADERGLGRVEEAVHRAGFLP